MRYDDAVSLYLRACQVRGLKAYTISGYREKLSYFRHFVRLEDVTDLTGDMIDDYILYLHGQDISKATVATYLRPIKGFLTWAETEGILNPNLKLSLAVKIPRAPSRKAQILSADQLHVLFSGIVVADCLSVRDGLILALMIDSGLRQNEVITLEVKNINFVDRTLKVYGKGDKERYVPLGKFTGQLIQRYLQLSDPHRRTKESRSRLLLDRHGNPITPNAVKLMIAKRKKKCGFDFSAHKLRHNFATNYCLDEYARNGTMDIFRLKAIMGHCNIETTMVYMHLAQELVAATTSISHLDQIDLHL